MTRFALIAAATAVLAAPTFAQTTNETAEEILNADADTPSEVREGTVVSGEVECMNPTVEMENESEDMVLEREDCVTGVDGEPEFAEETFEELEEDDDEGVGSDS
ncbi:hypothetical protein A8B78_05465 [Jannaschia sp. EhC01]|nr:hypothetical protein A8B78_05465 [Jannaschia sp. EhC01]